eukprot:jgi/Chlat1/8939/Chrsp94S08244
MALPATAVALRGVSRLPVGLRTAPSSSARSSTSRSSSSVSASCCPPCCSFSTAAGSSGRGTVLLGGVFDDVAGLGRGRRRSGRRSCRWRDTAACASSSQQQNAEGDMEELQVGSAIVVVELPPFLKTAEPMPMLRPSSAISVGEPGRIIDRRPKDTWAVRFRGGAFLMDGKYLRPLKREG